MNKEVEILATMVYKALENIATSVSTPYLNTTYLVDELKKQNTKYKTELDEDGDEILVEDGVKDEKLKAVLDKISKQLSSDRSRMWDNERAIRETILNPISNLRKAMLIYANPELKKAGEKTDKCYRNQ